MRFLYVMDPADRMHPQKDTTFAFMRAAQKKGHTNLHCLLSDLSVEGGVVYASTTVVTVSEIAPFVTCGSKRDVKLSDLDAILVRKDPPFETAYLQATQILDLARKDTLVMNDPRGLRDANEKLFALHFDGWMPRTYVTADPVRIRAFLDGCGGAAVIKPIDGKGGYGVMKLSSGDINTPAIIELLTEEGRRTVMVQEYLPAVGEGDKRVLLLDGELLGAVLRVPPEDDLRANLHVGGRAEICELTAREKELVASVGPRLRAAGLYFVGLDIIGERLTEINVTSPTGIQELARLSGTSPEDDVIAWVEEKARGFSRGLRGATMDLG